MMKSATFYLLSVVLSIHIDLSLSQEDCLLYDRDCEEVYPCLNNPRECPSTCRQSQCLDTVTDGICENPDCEGGFVCFNIGFCEDEDSARFGCESTCRSCFLVDSRYECGCEGLGSCPNDATCNANRGDFFGVCIPRVNPGPCFSEDVTVQLVNGKSIPIKDLNRHGGETVATVKDDGKLVYQEIYSFGHWNLYSVSRFLRIETNAKNSADNTDSAPLEISREHFLFEYDNASEAIGTPVLADTIKRGDFIMGRDGHRELVSSVSEIEKQGVFSPLVPDGTFLASGIKVSSYTTITAAAADGIQIPLSLHMLTHVAISPFRVLCRYNEGFCRERNAEGLLLFAATGEHLLSFLWLKEGVSIQATVIVMIFSGILPFHVLEQILGASVIIFISMISIAMFSLRLLFRYVQRLNKEK